MEVPLYPLHYMIISILLMISLSAANATSIGPPAAKPPFLQVTCGLFVFRNDVPLFSSFFILGVTLYLFDSSLVRIIFSTLLRPVLTPDFPLWENDEFQLEFCPDLVSQYWLMRFFIFSLTLTLVNDYFISSFSLAVYFLLNSRF